MSNKLQLLLPTDIIADSVEKINNNFRVVLSAKSMENFSLTSYKRYIENKFSELKNNVDYKDQHYYNLLNDELKALKSKLESLSSNISGDSDDDTIMSMLTTLAERDGQREKALAELKASIGSTNGDSVESQLTLLSKKDEELKSALAELSSTINDGSTGILARLQLLTTQTDTIQSAYNLLEAKLKNVDSDGVDFSEITSSLKNFVTRGEFEEAKTTIENSIKTNTDDISSIVNSYAKKTEVGSLAETAMKSTIDGITASIDTCVKKDANGYIDSSVKIAATNIVLEGNTFADQLYIQKLYANSNTRKTKIDSSQFEISNLNDSSSISIQIVEDMSKISGSDDAPEELKNASDVPTLCMKYNNKQYYLWPGAWKSIGGTDAKGVWDTKQFVLFSGIDKNMYDLIKKEVEHSVYGYTNWTVALTTLYTWTPKPNCHSDYENMYTSEKYTDRTREPDTTIPKSWYTGYTMGSAPGSSSINISEQLYMNNSSRDYEHQLNTFSKYNFTKESLGLDENNYKDFCDKLVLLCYWNQIVHEVIENGDDRDAITGFNDHIKQMFIDRTQDLKYSDIDELEKAEIIDVYLNSATNLNSISGVELIAVAPTYFSEGKSTIPKNPYVKYFFKVTSNPSLCKKHKTYPEVSAYMSPKEITDANPNTYLGFEHITGKIGNEYNKETDNIKDLISMIKNVFEDGGLSYHNDPDQYK